MQSKPPTRPCLSCLRSLAPLARASPTHLPAGSDPLSQVVNSRDPRRSPADDVVFEYHGVRLAVAGSSCRVPAASQRQVAILVPVMSLCLAVDTPPQAPPPQPLIRVQTQTQDRVRSRTRAHRHARMVSLDPHTMRILTHARVAFIISVIPYTHQAEMQGQSACSRAHTRRASAAPWWVRRGWACRANHVGGERWRWRGRRHQRESRRRRRRRLPGLGVTH